MTDPKTGKRRISQRSKRPSGTSHPVHVLPSGTAGEAGRAYTRPRPPAVNVLPSGTVPLYADEAGRVYSPGTLKFLEHLMSKREVRAHKAIPPVELSASAPAVEAALALHAGRRTEIQEKQKELSGLLDDALARSAYFTPAEGAELRKSYDDCKKLLEEISGQARVTTGQQSAALESFDKFRAQAIKLQITAGLAELTTLMEGVSRLGEDIEPAAHEGFGTLHKSCQTLLNNILENPSAPYGRAAAVTDLDEVRKRAEALQEQAAEIRANKATREALIKRAQAATKLAFEPVKGRRTPAAGDVLDVLKFDQNELARLANEVVTLDALRTKWPTKGQVDNMRIKLESFESRVAESRKFLDDINPRTPDELENSQDKNIVNNAMHQEWQAFVREAGKADRNMDALRANIAVIREVIDRKTPVTDEELLKLINPPKKVDLDALLKAAGNNKVVLKKCLEIEPRSAVLQDLFALTDVPSRLPGLLDSASKIGLTSDQVRTVLARCARRTTDAGNLFSMIRNTGKPVTWFLRGEGGQTLSDLIDILLAGTARIWSGQTCPAPTYGRLGGPPVTFDDIMHAAVPMEGASRPAPGGYAGNRPYGNAGVAPDMALPRRTAAGAPITYIEYDIRPYYPGIDRGSLRVVAGSDGRKYYTNHHYQSFELII